MPAMLRKNRVPHIRNTDNRGTVGINDELQAIVGGFLPEFAVHDMKFLEA